MNTFNMFVKKMIQDNMYFASRVKISPLIMSGYAIIFLVFVGFSFFMVSGIRQMHNVTQELYSHPYAVANASLEMKSALLQMRANIVYMVMIRKDENDIRLRCQEMDALNKTAKSDLAAIKISYIGSMDKIQELEILLEQWDVIRGDIIRDVLQGDVETAQQRVKNIGTPKFQEIITAVEYVLASAQEGAKALVEQGDRKLETKTSQVYVIMAVSVLIIFGTGLVVYFWAYSLQQELYMKATLDHLTGIPNRRYFLEIADRELARAKRYGTSLVMVIADLDLFKTINDTFGHQVGDMVLKRFSELCAKTMRETDVLGRIGGEEFALLLPDTGIDEAKNVVERIRQAVADMEIVLQDASVVCFTASFGVSKLLPEDTSMISLYGRADAEMYKAKLAGRNRVCVG